MRVTNGRVTVAILKARYALAVIARIADEQRFAAGALGTDCVVLTMKANIQLVRSGAF